jgi:hypothetical protein
MATDLDQIVLNDEQKQMLADAAEQLGRPWAVIFEQAMAPLVDVPSTSNEENRNGQTAFQILATHGLIGCVEGTPPDLSTNRKHMEGYGSHG